MDVYLPIAEMTVNVPVVLGMGSVVGFLSGMFGVGGGFLMTPLLIFIGVPPAVAVGTQANQLVAASVSGVLVHWRRDNVDVKMGLVMLAGSALGAMIGVGLFALLKRAGQIDLVISLAYVLLLGTVSLSMLAESVLTALRRRRPAIRGRLRHHSWLHRLPFKTRFSRSKLYISALLPFGIGLAGGIMVAVMGIGGGFLLVPAMIYLLGMPVTLVVGTSLFQISITTAVVTVLQAATNRTVDALLALLLLLGGVVGAQIGSRVGGRLGGETLRMLLAVIVLAVAAKLAVDLIAGPAEPYSILVETTR